MKGLIAFSNFPLELEFLISFSPIASSFYSFLIKSNITLKVFRSYSDKIFGRITLLALKHSPQCPSVWLNF